VAHLPVLDAPNEERLARVIDVEGKIPRALESLGPIAERDVLLVESGPRLREQQLGALGARVRVVGGLAETAALPAESVDVVVGGWSAFRDIDPADVAAVNRLLRPSGRLLVVHDYGRDDVSRLRGDQPEHRTWSRRDGPFLSAGFRVRVLHCWWTFASLEEAGEVLGSAFGSEGREVAAGLKRPRLSYKVAVYHRGRGGEPAPA